MDNIYQVFKLSQTRVDVNAFNIIYLPDPPARAQIIIRFSGQRDRISFHSIRHTVRRTWRESWIVGKILGHSNVSTTQRYAHLEQNPARKAAEDAAAKIAKAMSKKNTGKVVAFTRTGSEA